MENVLIDIVIYIAVGLAVSLLAKQYNFTPMLGYIVAGVFIGPYAFDVISLEQWSHSAGEYGVVFLLFTLGLSFTWNKLWELRYYVLLVGSLQVLLCAVVAGSFFYFCGVYLGTSLFLGVIFAFSSTAVVGEILSERNEYASKHGRITLSILLFQDLAVLFVLVWAKLLNAQFTGSLLVAAMHALVKAVIIMIICALLWKFILRPIYRWVSATKRSDLLTSMMLLMVLLLSLLTNLAGLSPELGAFLAGMLLGDTEYQSQVDVDIKPFRYLLLGLFFITIGMSMNTQIFVTNFFTVLMMLSALIILKFSIIFGILMAFGRVFPSVAVRVAGALAGGSEFGLLLLQRGKAGLTMTVQLADILGLVLILSLVLTPFLIRVTRVFSQKLLLSSQEEEFSGDKDVPMCDHVVVAGVGQVGYTILRVFQKLRIPYIAIDNSVKRVRQIQKETEGVFFGDVSKLEILKKAHIENAKAFVVCTDHFANAEQILKIMRNQMPHLPIIVRVQTVSQIEVVRKYGGVPIAPDLDAVSLNIVSHTLHALAFSEDRIEHTLHELRLQMRAR